MTKDELFSVAAEEVGCGAEYGIILLLAGRPHVTWPPAREHGERRDLCGPDDHAGFWNIYDLPSSGHCSLGVLSFMDSLLVMLAALVLIPALLAGRQPLPQRPEDEVSTTPSVVP